MSQTVRTAFGRFSRVPSSSHSLVGARFLKVTHLRSFTTHPTPRSPSVLLSLLGMTAGVLGGVAWVVRSRNVHSESMVIRKGERGLSESFFGEVMDLQSRGHGRKDVDGVSASLPRVPPQYTRHDVSTHTTKETGIWIIHDNGVYDITEFVDMHPGGERILMAAGRSIDPFWSVFTIHQTPETKALLEQYRIGDLTAPKTATEREEAQIAEQRDRDALKDLFVHDPKRHPGLHKHAEFPCNAETPPHAIIDTPITPTPLFFVRNHLPVPKIDPEHYKLAIEGLGIADTALSLDELKRLPKVTVTATLQCAGNRRKDMHEVKPTKGLQWEQGAISTATWGGVLLRDVLSQAGYDPTTTDHVSHVQFHGAEGYGASIPASKALSSTGDVLLAYEMNGEALPADHGAPVRVIVPGHVAARSVKWVDRITLSEEESESHWQRRDYKGFCPSVENVGEKEYEKARSIQELPVQSAVLSPRRDERVMVDNGSTVCAKGYAVSGGGRDIVRVDVSGDGGKTWTEATLQESSTQGRADARQWAWRLWEAQVSVPGEGRTEIVCKAVDEGYNSQPEGMAGIWNVRGVLSTAWHRVAVDVVKEEKEEKEGSEGVRV